MQPSPLETLVYAIVGVVSKGVENVVLLVAVDPTVKCADNEPVKRLIDAGLVPVNKTPFTQAVYPLEISAAVAVPGVSSYPFLKGVTVSAPAFI